MKGERDGEREGKRERERERERERAAYFFLQLRYFGTRRHAPFLCIFWRSGARRDPTITA